MEINKELLDNLFEQAKENPRLRQNFDLRNIVSRYQPAYAECSVARNRCTYPQASTKYGECFSPVR